MENQPLLMQVRDNILKHGLLEKGDGVVVGVSGGADSVCLIRVLKELQREFELKILAVHVHHGLRGQEADEDMKYVEDICRNWDIPLKVHHVDINALSKKVGKSVEEVGRDVRYELFNREMVQSKLNLIAVAHNLEDQAETVMLNLIRGTGLDGLCAMKMKQGCIIRPLLNISRNMIVDFLQTNSIPYRVDSTNLENEYARNKVRNVIFPKVFEGFGINLSKQLSRLSFILQDDRDYLDEVSKGIFLQILIQSHLQELELDIGKLKNIHVAIVKRIIRLAWERINNSRKNLEQIHIEQIQNLCKNNHTGKRVELPGGVVVETCYDRLIFKKGAEKQPEDYEYEIETEGTTVASLAKGILEARVLDGIEAVKIYGKPEDIKENSLFQIFDYDSLSGKPVLRNRRNGDRISPFGATGHKKLKDYFIDKKVPQKIRSQIPLLAIDNKIMWIVGMRTSKDFRARSDSKRVWVLSWHELKDGGYENGKIKGFSK